MHVEPEATNGLGQTHAPPAPATKGAAQTHCPLLYTFPEGHKQLPDTKVKGEGQEQPVADDTRG